MAARFEPARTTSSMRLAAITEPATGGNPFRVSTTAMNYVEEQQDETLGSAIGALFNSERFSDVVFLVGKERERFNAHKAILAARSRVFEDILFNSDEGASGEVKADDIQPRSFAAILRFIYTDTIDITAETAINTLYASKKFGLTKLRTACLDFVETQLDIENVCVLLTQAEMLDETELVYRCLVFIAQHPLDVFATVGFQQLTVRSLDYILASGHLVDVEEIHIFRACLTWAEAECRRQHASMTKENRRTVLQDIIPLIRFPLMTAGQLADEVAPSGVLTDHEIAEVFVFLAAQNTKPQVSFVHEPRTPGSPTRLAAHATPLPGFRGTANIYDISKSMGFDQTL